MKNTHGRVLLLVKLWAEVCNFTVLIVTLLHSSFSRFLNCTNGGTSRKRHYCRVHERDQFLTKKKDNDPTGAKRKEKATPS